MHFFNAVYLLSTTLALSQAQSSYTPAAAAPTAVDTDDFTAYVCTAYWAGSPNSNNVPQGQQLPPKDLTRRLFIEPQLQNVPFSPIIGSELKVQLPKVWGNGNFRVALLSYATTTPANRVYASGVNRWADFHSGLEFLMRRCVQKHVGGAYLIAPPPGLTQSTMVVYAYEIGSKFDDLMNHYMSEPRGIDFTQLTRLLANSSETGAANLFDLGVPNSAAVEYTASSLTAAPPAGYSYVGCYNDTSGERALSASQTLGSGMTEQACATFCGTTQYFGLEFGDQCYCGNSIGSGSLQVNDGCDMACAGDKAEACGGAEHLTIYQRQTQTA